MKADIDTIVNYLDSFLIKNKRDNIQPVEANILLENASILNNSNLRSGLPLRKILRKGLIPHAYQANGKGSRWTIPHSSNK
ncbi:hypothetical protein [Mucilaginibacter antarcticus]|uniref:Uncharacterized protein n=1 Tax=Mucilaginibacter antarcticus TaxID=1855725 RepID=A0ABW5XP80_9SPHI